MRDDQDKLLESRFRKLLQGNLARLRRIARSYARDGEHEDLLQEILMQIWRSLPGFEDRARLSTWVYKIALNTALGSLRKRYKQPETHFMTDDQLVPLRPSSAGDPVDMNALLDGFLAALEPIDRAVLSNHPILLIGGAIFWGWGLIYAPRRWLRRFEPQATHLECLLRDTRNNSRTDGDAR